jgi:hypothetical protein
MAGRATDDAVQECRLRLSSSRRSCLVSTGPRVAGSLVAARFVQPALVKGAVGLVTAPRGRLSKVLSFTITGGKIVQIDVVADPERLRELDLAVLND